MPANKHLLPLLRPMAHLAQMVTEMDIQHLDQTEMVTDMLLQHSPHLNMAHLQAMDTLHKLLLQPNLHLNMGLLVLVMVMDILVRSC
jgi:hypothetical protein